MLKRNLTVCAFAAIGLVASAAEARPGDASTLAGSWSGPSFDETFGIPGELSGTLELRAGGTFNGLIDATYSGLDPAPPPQHCSIIAGYIDDTGAIVMAGTCKYEGYPQGEGFVMEGQLDESGDVIQGTWQGAYNSVGVFTLTRD